MNQTLKIAKIYDNGGKTMDRYTVTFRSYAGALGLSDNCNRLNGFSQWRKVLDPGPYLGKEISFLSLPVHIQRHIGRRITEE